MKPRLLFPVGVVLFAIASLAAIPAVAQTISNGPYYATPSWDMKLQCDTQATCPRFIVLSNWNSEAVLDRETGLIWEQSPSGAGQATWHIAQVECILKAVGNRKGWRLPTIQELESLIDPTVAAPGPQLPPGHPFSNVQAANPYWSATTNGGDTTFAFQVRFSDRVLSSTKDTSGFLAWCVRGGQGVDPQ